MKMENQGYYPSVRRVLLVHMYDLKNKNKLVESPKRVASLEATRLTKITEWLISDMENLEKSWTEDQAL
jgi:hypothetical protein